MPNKIQILSTRPLNKTLLQEANQAGIDIDEFSFIETTPLYSEPLQMEIDDTFQQAATIVFTSMNAVEAVASQIKEKIPRWKIYCIGTTTRQLVANHFGQDAIAGTANDAASLAELIVEDQPKEKIIFFCGDQRRDELPGILQQHSIEAREIVVYKTTAIQQQIKKQYEGILFFSPSAVESFLVITNSVKKQSYLPSVIPPPKK